MRFRVWSAGFAGLAVLLALVVSSAGCRTGPQALFTTSGSGWHIQEGQALWDPGRGIPELGGELLVATNTDGRGMIQFAKTPITLVLAQTTRTNWLIQFPPRRMSFTGHGMPPAHFAWLHLQRAFSGEPISPDFRFERLPEGRWRLENVRSGERVEGFLIP